MMSDDEEELPVYLWRPGQTTDVIGKWEQHTRVSSAAVSLAWCSLANASGGCFRAWLAGAVVARRRDDNAAIRIIWYKCTMSAPEILQSFPSVHPSVCLSICFHFEPSDLWPWPFAYMWVMTIALMGLKVKVRFKAWVSVWDAVSGTSIEDTFLVDCIVVWMKWRNIVLLRLLRSNQFSCLLVSTFMHTKYWCCSLLTAALTCWSITRDTQLFNHWTTAGGIGVKIHWSSAFCRIILSPTFRLFRPNSFLPCVSL